MITLQNEKLTAVIANKGAELQQLTSKGTGINYMWSGDDAYWGKHSPVLFPIVGGLKYDTYYYKDNAYQLPRHGFARQKEFVSQQLSSTEVIFTLQHDDQTLAVYPFAFTLKLLYQLNNNWLVCTYEVHNPGDDVLLFSVGAHPAFAVPLTSGTAYQDYYLEFNKPEEMERWKIKNGLIDTHTQPLLMKNGRLALQHELFYEDAIVLKGLESNCISLASHKHKHGFNFYFNGFDFFGIWAAKDAPFVCLEPWCGIGDHVNHNQQLMDKEGIRLLEPGEVFSRTWSVECF
jgi:galactose mutarotase-like enzyme